MLKIIGELPLPRTWAVTLVKSTGHYVVDWMPSCAPSAKFNAEVEEAKAELKAEFPKGEPEQLPDHGYHYSDRSDEARAARDADHENRRIRNRFNHLTTLTDKSALTFHPVFKGVLKFTGYSKGQSKVTMNFESDNGQKIPFGTTGISDMMNRIASGDIKIADGLFHIVFTLEKKGANVYAYPHYPEAE